MPMNAGTFIMIILYINYFDMSGYTVYESLHDKSEPGLSGDYHHFHHEMNFTIIECDDDTEILKKAVNLLKVEKSLQSPRALAALSTASKFLEWAGDSGNQADLKDFSRKLVEALKKCIPDKCTRNPLTQREKMWSSFHMLRVSDPFKKLWHEFLDLCCLEKHPIFFQRISDLIFQELITKEFTVTTHDAPTVTSTTPITYEEANALRYVAGYVCRKVKQNIESSKHPFKGALLLCMMDMCDEDDDTSSSADWLNAVDRGGLCRVSEATVMLFHEIELLVRKVFNKEIIHSQVTELTCNLKEKVIESALADENVQFHWCLITTDIEDDKATILLKMIMELFVTIRGFSFAKSFMELYKQSTKKSTQKSKALRKKIYNDEAKKME